MKRALSLLLALLMVISILPLPTVSAEDDSVFVLPTGLQEVEEQAFAGNTSISKLVIPSGVKSIGREAFADCTGLTEVSIAGTEVSIDKDAFLNCSRDIVFYAHEGSSAMLWAMSHGFRCVSLDEDSDYLGRFMELVSYSGFDPSLLMSSTFASKCLIVRTPDAMVCLPDISEFNPIDIFRSDEHLYYIQFATEDDTEGCFNFLHGNSDISVEPDRIGAADDVSAQGVTIAENWGTDDTMGFDVYAPYVAEHSSGSVTIAVIDSGVRTGVWGGIMSGLAASFVDFNVFNDTARHGSKVVSIINDCLGSNKSKVTLLPIKAVNSSSMYRTSVIIESIKYAANHGANIINLCLGWDISEGTSPEIERQIKAANEKGILVVAAAGNGNGSVMYPASCDGVIAVSALTYSIESGYSVRSRTGSAVDYTAPGMYLATSAYNPVDPAGDIIGTASTSFAAPQITAALALIQMDSTHVGSAPIILDSCCLDLGPEGLSSSAYGRGLPQLGDLVLPVPIIPKNADGGPIPSRLWLGDKENDFILSWEVNSSNPNETNVTVVSSKPSVASVRQYGNSFALITAKGKGETVISLSNSRVTTEFTLVIQQPVTEILLTGPSEPMIVEDKFSVAVAVSPEDANNKNVIWSSSNEAVATVTQTGHLEALTPGTTTITCEATDGYGTKGQVEITVLDIPDATAISLTAKEKEIENNAVTLEVGESLTLIASIQPEEALQECRFSVFPKGIVTVSDDGIVTALESGAGKSATIVATATTGNNVYTGLTVSVVISPVSVNIIADKTTLDIGETTTLTAVVDPENATDKTVSWTSKNTAVATVNSKSGQVKAVAPGSAEIVCTTANGKTASITVTVRQPITITLDPNGGTCDKSKIDAYSGYPIGALPTPTREYYTFNGWYTAKSGGTKVTETTVFTEATTIYAHWTPMQYTMRFDANGGSVSPTQKTCYVDTPAGDLPTPTRPYYTFLGWFMTKSGGTQITQNYTQGNNTDLTVYAHWKAETYTITLNENYDGGSIIIIHPEVGEHITLPTPTRPYYTFQGWFTAKTGGTKFNTDYVQSTTSSLTLYAHWSPNPYTMTFDANGGTCSEKTRTCYVDTDIGDVPTPSKPYYDFEGWYTTDGKTHVTSTYQQATDAAITVRAKWTPHTYTMSFDPNGGNCDTSSIIGTVGKAIGTLPTPTKSYYTFNGWYTAKSGGNKIDSTYVQHTDDDIPVYAHWTPNPYTMTFDANGGSVSPTSKPCYVDTKVGDLPTPDGNPDRNYYTFKGWFTAKSGGTEITSSYKQPTDQSITVYARWEPGTYTITLNANGGSCSTTSMPGTVDVPVTLPKPTRDNYDFLGWYTGGTGGTQVASPSKLEYTQSNTTDRTFYAQWKPQQYTMIFDANGGMLVNSNDSIKYFDVDTPIDVSKLPKATRSRYTFNGWYTKETGGTKIDKSFTHGNTTAITVYAHWDPIYVTGITIVTNPSTTSYIAGDKFNASGLTIKATYNDGTVENHGASDCTVSSPDMKTTGTKQVTVSYGGKSATFNITVNALTISVSANTSNGSSGYINLSASVPRGTVSWTSSDSNVATVDSSGKVTFKKTVGTAKITATVNNNGVTNSASKTITVSNSQGTKFGETSSSTTGTVLYGSRPDGYSTEFPVATGSIPSYTTNSADVSYSSTNTSNGRIEVKYTNNGVDGYVYYQFNYNSSTGGDNIYKIINFEPTDRRCYINDGSTPNYAFYESFGRQFYSATNYPEARAEQNWTQYTAYWWAYRDKQAGHTWYTAKSIGTGLAASWYRFPLTKYTKTTTTYTYYYYAVS